MYVCLYTLCMHLCIYAYLYICIHMNSSMSVCVYVRSGRGNVLYCRESCPGVSCPGVSCPGGGRGPFPMRRRARDLVPYATMYTSAFISVRQQAFKAPAYEGVSKCIFSCFIYYGVKANVRSFGVNSIQMLFISQTTNSKLSWGGFLSIGVLVLPTIGGAFVRYLCPEGFGLGGTLSNTHQNRSKSTFII